MTATRKVDQYLAYYIALESIAKHVPGVTRGPRRNRRGEEEPGVETQENAAIRYLLSRHKGLPLHAQKTLKTIRARIAHGNADMQTLKLANKNLPALQRLAADGIALVLGIDPALFNVQEPSRIELMAPGLRAQYSAEHDPIKRWGGLLSEVFAYYLENAPSIQHEQTSNVGKTTAPRETLNP